MLKKRERYRRSKERRYQVVKWVKGKQLLNTQFNRRLANRCWNNRLFSWDVSSDGRKPFCKAGLKMVNCNQIRTGL
jgi:hypothetical protein